MEKIEQILTEYGLEKTRDIDEKTTLSLMSGLKTIHAENLMVPRNPKLKRDLNRIIYFALEDLKIQDIDVFTRWFPSPVPPEKVPFWFFQSVRVQTVFDGGYELRVIHQYEIDSLKKKYRKQTEKQLEKLFPEYNLKKRFFPEEAEEILTHSLYGFLEKYTVQINKSPEMKKLNQKIQTAAEEIYKEVL